MIYNLTSIFTSRRMSMLHADRYHFTQANFSLRKHAKMTSGDLLADEISTFYLTQRKLKFAPCVGHERLLRTIFSGGLDVPHLRFLREDKANLDLVANKLAMPDHHNYEIRTVRPGTIVFAGEPFADITGTFWDTQMKEVAFEHAFDQPMTVAGRALRMRLAAGDRNLSVFSLRRDGSPERSLEVSKWAYIGGFDDTSFVEAAYQLDINPVGTMAHYLVQAFTGFMNSIHSEKHPQGARKHFQETAFERWLDAHPKGTTLLLDTINLKLGLIHAIRAAKSSTERRQALKFVRIDSGDLSKNARWARQTLDANDMKDVGIFLTSDLDESSIREILKNCPFVNGFGVGTKLAAEVDSVAGVIFKLCRIGDQVTRKLSETPGKGTLAGKTQIWRYIDHHGRYAKDLITIDDERPPLGTYLAARPLIQRFFGEKSSIPQIPGIAEQRQFVKEQLHAFPDIENYPVEISESLKHLNLTIENKMLRDEAAEAGVIMVPYPE